VKHHSHNVFYSRMFKCFYVCDNDVENEEWMKA
jgi:hypothetical protein